MPRSCILHAARDKCTYPVLFVVRCKRDNNVRYARNQLTFDVHGDPLADRGRHAIGRDAEVSAHFAARDPRQV